MPVRGPIPEDSAELFNQALALFYAWIMDELRERHLQPRIVQQYSIGMVCDLVQAFDDSMQANAYELLISLASAHAVPIPKDRSYASGATCLRALKGKYLESIGMNSI
jgi:hypothetical protein